MAPYLIPRTQKVTLDSNGNGTVTFEIDNTNKRWVLDSVHVQVTDANGNPLPTSTPVPAVNCYLNSVTPNGFRGGTLSGNLDTATGRAILYEGDTLYVVWTGGAPGTVGNVTIDGTYDGAGSKIDD